MARPRSFGVVRIVTDLVSLLIVGVPILIFKVVAQPYQRGFYCDDESLMHPHKSDTIPIWVAALVGITLPVACVIIVEGLRFDVFRQCGSGCTQEVQQYLKVIYRIIGAFAFGLLANQMATDIAKYSIGRLRPHFRTVCSPNLMTCDSTTGYLEDASICTGTDTKALREARLSFPSGHSSMSFYTMTFLIVYLHVRFRSQSGWLLRPMLQALAFYMAYYTALSRISDYMHHWSDVLAGSILGIIVCILVVVFLSGLVGGTTCCEPVPEDEEALVPCLRYRNQGSTKENNTGFQLEQSE